VERSNLQLRGKGHALAFGVAHWRSDPPEVVVVLDADCIPAPGALDLLAVGGGERCGPARCRRCT
jgi:cellulose synthase/poly-beta-1,6-N-acetylglucosamine synthase-like glycosyltransferase